MPSTVYSYTGGWRTFKVPAGVTYVEIACEGAGVATRSGERVAGRRSVTAGQVLYLTVGGQGIPHVGTIGGNGGWPGGGDGGNGSGGSSGGNGGGGYSQVRVGSTVGTIICVAGGSGGDSNDGGAGGQGAAGRNGTSGTGLTVPAGAGTRTQGGKGGTSSASAKLAGQNALDTTNSWAGNGGSALAGTGYGGGGGGGGLRGGGGGQAGLTGFAPAGGGGGGFSYTGGLSFATIEHGGGGLSHGHVTISWDTPNSHEHRPNSPTSVVPAPDTATKSIGTLAVSAILSDPDADLVRLMVRLSRTTNFASYRDTYSGYVKSGGRAVAHLSGLSQNIHYYARLYAQDSPGSGNLFSINYSSTNFWTNREPDPPVLTAPGNNTQTTSISPVVFSWTPSDPDPSSAQNGAQIRWKNASIVEPFTTRTITGTTTTHTESAGVFKSNTFYSWSVRTRDPQGTWGQWSLDFRFYVAGTASAPALLSPIKGEAQDVTTAITFAWKFLDPDPGDTQAKADIRWRVQGTDDTAWVTVLGDTVTPGAVHSWAIPANTFGSGFQWEWQIRTYDTLGGGIVAGPWSSSAFFWGVYSPGSLAIEPVVPALGLLQGSLGCGTYRIFVYRKGGQIRVGEVTPIMRMQWERVRDDISGCLLTTSGFGSDCGELLANTRTWAFELVVFRDGKRVWEGPITRLEYTTEGVEMEAKDVMAWVYRRIMRSGYNDSYPHISTVVYRAERIIINALAPDDPNVMAYLTSYNFPDDAHQSRVREDYSSTAWEEVDDLAATAGLDYTVVGRRIILWDTHRPIGLLPEMRDGDFSSAPVVSEYGMNLAGTYAVTNGNGVYGIATNPGALPYYGLVELLASAYGNTAAAADDVLTPAGRAALQHALTDQATRGISARFPAPLVVRIPDSSTLSPDVAVDINYLVPGVWIPLHATGTLRKVTQLQKLDRVTVVVDENGSEAVQVTMSPAPGTGADPDAGLGDPNLPAI